MQNKKGFTLIELMIVVAIVAILAMVAVPMYQKYIERSRNTAAQTLLQQISLAQIASQTDATVAGKDDGDKEISTTGYLFVNGADDKGNVELLMDFGFRPDPNVGFVVLEPAADDDGVVQDGFVAFACHKAKNAQAFAYDNVTGGGVQTVIDTTTEYAGNTLPESLYIFTLQAGAAKATVEKVLTIEMNGVKSSGTVS